MFERLCQHAPPEIAMSTGTYVFELSLIHVNRELMSCASFDTPTLALCEDDAHGSDFAMKSASDPLDSALGSRRARSSSSGCRVQ